MNSILKFSLFTLLLLVPSITAQSGNIMDLSSDDINTILSIHNQVRSDLVPTVQSMPMLQWSSGLASMWADWSATCAFAHTPNDYRTNKAGFSYVGENLAYVGGDATLDVFTSGWLSEKSAYTYGPMTLALANSAGHYTQLVWSRTTYVGCTKVDCTGTSTGGYILACNYGLGGNGIGSYPYKLKGDGTESGSLVYLSSEGDGSSSKHLTDGQIAGVVIGTVVGFICVLGIAAGIIILIVLLSAPDFRGKLVGKIRGIREVRSGGVQEVSRAADVSV